MYKTQPQTNCVAT